MTPGHFDVINQKHIILQAIKNGHATRHDIVASASGINPTQVKSYLPVLLGSKHIKRDGEDLPARYVITDLGRAYLNGDRPTGGPRKKAPPADTMTASMTAESYRSVWTRAPYIPPVMGTPRQGANVAFGLPSRGMSV